MVKDKDRLDIDLGFLDQAKPRDAETKAVSKYKFNWRNITIIVGIIGGLFVWGSINYNHPSPRSYPSTYTPPAASHDDTVANGQFRCSSYDSRQANALSPSNEVSIQKETDDLNLRAQELDALKTKINTNTVNQYSPQYLIDSYNGMIDTFNAQLTDFKTDSAAHQQRVDIFNAQVEAHNNYLIAHCRRSY